MIKSYQVRIMGRVQGVFYRASMRDKAYDLGVVGFVMNKEDGSVYAEIEGEEETLGKMIDWCKQGPRNSIVDEVNWVEQANKAYKNFEITRSF